MKGETAWLSMRVPARGAPFEIDGRMVQEVGEVIQKWPVNAAVAGLLTALPEGGWSAAQRDEWLRVLRVVLDYAIPVTDEAPSDA